MKLKLFLLISITWAITLNAQTLDLTGTIVDTHNIPIPNATISLNDGKFWTTSDDNGKWKFSLRQGIYHLNTYYLGYETYQQYINLSNNKYGIKIIIKPSIESLNEVEVIVDAAKIRKKEASLDINIVGKGYIAEHLQTSLMKSLEDLPGISSIGIGSSQAKPVIRGLSFNRVTVIENGIKHEAQQWGSEHGLEIDPFSVKKLEIIKGPQSLLYGSDAIGGSIIINNTNFPLDNGLKQSLHLNYKSVNQSIGGSYNIIFRENKFYIDSRFTYNDYADYKVPTDHVQVYSYKVKLKNNRLRNTAGKNLTLYAQMGWISKPLTSHLFLSYYHSEDAFFANAHGLEPQGVDTLLHDKSHRDLQYPNQKAQHLKAVFNTTYSGNNKNNKWEFKLGGQKNRRQETNSYIAHGHMPVIYPKHMTIPANLERYFDKDVFDAKIQFETKYNNKTFYFGINGDWQNNKIDGCSFIIPSYRKLGVGTFALSKIKLNQHIVNIGVRYDFANLNTDTYTDWFKTPIANTKDSIYIQRTSALNKNYQNLTYAIGWSYQNKTINLKSNIGKSFRVPIAKELTSNGVNFHRFSYEKGDDSLNPEISYQWDVSTKLNFSKWAVQVTPYISYFPNYIYLNPSYLYDTDYGAGNQIYNYMSTKVLRTGLESNLQYQIINHLKVEHTLEYLYAEQLSGSKKGFGLPFSPPLKVTNKITYKLSDYKTLEGTQFGLGHIYRNKQDRLVPPEKTTDASSTFNFSCQTNLIWGKQNLNLQFQLNNILNQKYFNHTDYYRIIGVPESGRNFSFGVNLEF